MTLHRLIVRERMILGIVARGPADQQHDFARNVHSVIVVVGRRFARDPISSEHDRAGGEARPRQADGLKVIVQLELFGFAPCLGEVDAGAGGERRIAADQERLKISGPGDGFFQAGRFECGGDVRGRLVNTLGARSPAFAGVGREKGQVGPHPGDDRVGR